MKFLKTVIVAGLIGLPVIASAESKTHFSLHNQLFSETKDATKMTGARYDLPYVYATTNLIYEGGVYTTLNDNGFFNAELKDPAAKWAVSVDIFCGFDSYTPERRSIKLTAENGESVIISMQWANITFNGVNVFKVEEDSRLTIGVKNDGADVQLTLNGSIVGSGSFPDFNKLKYVEVQLVDESSDADVLHEIIIGER